MKINQFYELNILLVMYGAESLLFYNINICYLPAARSVLYLNKTPAQASAPATAQAA
jgi:hypothetical protein